MVDKKIEFTPFEKEIAKAYGITPEDVHISAELGVKPDDLLEARSVGWRAKQRQIDEAEAEALKGRSEAPAGNVGLDRHFERIITGRGITEKD